MKAIHCLYTAWLGAHRNRKWSGSKMARKYHLSGLMSQAEVKCLQYQLLHLRTAVDTSAPRIILLGNFITCLKLPLSVRKK